MILSLLLLIIVNFIPAAGVIWFNWHEGQIIALYWAECVVIGFYTILQILIYGYITNREKKPKAPFSETILAACFFGVCFFFFIVLTFMFLLAVPHSDMLYLFEFNRRWRIERILASGPFATMIVFMSCGFSVYIDYINQKGKRVTSKDHTYSEIKNFNLFWGPFARIGVIMAVAVIGGSISSAIDGHTFYVFIGWIGCKFLTDLAGWFLNRSTTR